MTVEHLTGLDQDITRWLDVNGHTLHLTRKLIPQPKFLIFSRKSALRLCVFVHYWYVLVHLTYFMKLFI